MGQIINPNNINDYSLNIQMKGEPGSSPVLIPSSYITVNDENIKPGINDTAISNVELSKLDSLNSVLSSKNTSDIYQYDICTKFIWNPNTNTLGKISPNSFDIYPEGKNYDFSSFGGTYNIIIANDIYSTVVPTSNTKGERAFDNIYLAGKVKTDDGEVDINIDRNGNPIYLSGLLSEEDEEWDNDIKTTLGIKSDAGIIGQDADNYPEPTLGITLSSNSTWATPFYSGINNASYLWGQKYVTEKLPYDTDITEYSKVKLTLSPNVPSSTNGTVSGTLATQVVSNDITYKGGTVKVRVGNTKDSSGNVTGFVFTDANNSQSITQERTATITYTYNTYCSNPTFNGSGTFTITQAGGNVTTPNPSITYLFDEPSYCTLSKTEQGPQFKDGEVGEVDLTIDSNEATRGKITFSEGSNMSIRYGNELLGIRDCSGTTTPDSDKLSKISSNGGTYLFGITYPTVKMPVNTSSRTVSFKNYITKYNDGDGSNINNNPLVWSTTQPGQTISNPYIRFTYNYCNHQTCSTGTLEGWITNVSKPILIKEIVIPPNTGDYSSAITNPYIHVDNTHTTTVPDAGATISVKLAYANGLNYKIPIGEYNWTPGQTLATDPRTFTIDLMNIEVNDDSTDLDTSYAPIMGDGKGFTLTQLGSEAGEKKYEPVTVTGSLSTYMTSVTSATLTSPTDEQSIQFTFPAATQPKRNGFTMTLADDENCAKMNLKYTTPSGTFDSTTSTLSISKGALSSNQIVFNRPAVYPDFPFTFTTSNKDFVNYNGQETWTETFTYIQNGSETNDWTIDESKANVRYTNVINISGSLSVKDGSNSFSSNNIVISTKQTGSTASVSATITATDQDGNKDSVTITRAGKNYTGITYTYTSSNVNWRISNMYYNNSLATYVLAGAIRGVATTTPTSTTITITARSNYDNTIQTIYTMYACRRGVVPCTITDENSVYQWVDVTNDDGSIGATYTYSFASGASLSCTTSGSGSIDYWTTSRNVTGTPFISNATSTDGTTYNVIITYSKTQKKQQRTGSYNAIYDCAGNVSIESYTYTDWADVTDSNGNVVTRQTGSGGSSTVATGTLAITYSLDGGNMWYVSNSYPVTKTLTPDNYGNSESTTGDKKYAYFRSMLVYKNTCIAYSSQTTAWVNKYGVTYHNE